MESLEIRSYDFSSMISGMDDGSPKKYVCDPGRFSGVILTCMTDGKHCDYFGRTLEELRVEKNNPDLVLVSWEQLKKMIDAFCDSVCEPFTEITDKRYYEIRDSVPCLFGLGFFYTTEPYYGNVYQTAFEHGGKYYTALCNYARGEHKIALEIADFCRNLKSS